jgi:molybdopterin-synthase adenylyltransferase
VIEGAPVAGGLGGALHVIAMTALQRAELWRALLADAPLESVRFLLARPVRTPAGAWRLVVYDAVPVDASEYVRRTPVAIELPPTVVARVLQRARADGTSVILAHSHPGATAVGPSPADLAGEERLLPTMRRRSPGVPHARLIVGDGAVDAALFDVDGREYPARVVGVGSDITIEPVVGSESPATGRVANQEDTYDRQVRAFGETGQSVLGQLRVGIVGLGGTGSVVAQQLAHLGVGSIRLIDPDVIEATNLNRVVGATPIDVGRPKVEVARRLIMATSQRTCVIASQLDILDADVARTLLDTDVVFSCTDTHGSRAVVSILAYQYLVPVIDLGVAIQTRSSGTVSHISGRVQLLVPDLPCLVCAGVLDSEAVRRELMTEVQRAADPYIVGAPVRQPAVISINSTVASLAVTMMLSAVTGVPVVTRHQRLRLEAGIVSPVEGMKNATCPVCSAPGALVRGDSWPRPGRVA